MIEAPKRVSVAVRVRPVLRSGGSHSHQQEKFELEATSRINDTQIKVEQKRQEEACRSSVFSFDYIFDQESTQLEVYEDAAVELVDGALTGINATILAYGQTGSGKTHTVLGEVKHNPLENDLLTSNSGLFLRVLNDLMEYKKRREKDLHVIVGLSCVEIYNDTIRDLFGGSPNETPPTIKASMVGDDVYLPSLIIKEVTTLSAVFSEIQLAISRRQSRSTEMNAASSRSHCLFMIDILQAAAAAPKPSLSLLDTQKNSGNGDDKVSRTRGMSMAETKKDPKNARARGQTMGPNPSSSTPPTASPTTAQPQEVAFLGTILNVPGQTEPVWASKILLADLAGSERIKNSGVVGDGLAEATAINSSLTALGKVVHSLHEGSYVSYRSSSLTTLLKPTFCHPCSRVLLLAQVSPTQLTYDETVNTLHFANRVKDMKVTTTTGAEAEKMLFDFIESEKMYDALVGDLRIWSVESGCRTVIRRQMAKQNSIPALYYDQKARRPHKRDERRAALEQLGYLEVAAAEKDQQIVQRQRDIEREERQLHELHADERRIQVTAYKEQRGELESELKSASSDATSHQIKILVLDSSAITTGLAVDEEVDFAVLMSQHFEGLKQLGALEIQKLDAELAALSDQTKLQKSRSGNAVFTDPQQLADQEEASSQALGDDATYANACWGHCAAKRFFASVMELREGQLRLNIAKTQTTALSNWLKKKDASEGK
jgi:hypothetical protein